MNERRRWAGLYQSPPSKATQYKVFFMSYSAGPRTATRSGASDADSPVFRAFPAIAVTMSYRAPDRCGPIAAASASSRKAERLGGSSVEHPSEPQSLMRISYDVYWLEQKKRT